MRKSRLSVHKQAKLLEHLLAGTTARTAAELVGVNKTTAAYYFHLGVRVHCAGNGAYRITQGGLPTVSWAHLAYL